MARPQMSPALSIVMGFLLAGSCLLMVTLIHTKPEPMPDWNEQYDSTPGPFEGPNLRQDVRLQRRLQASEAETGHDARIAVKVKDEAGNALGNAHVYCASEKRRTIAQSEVLAETSTDRSGNAFLLINVNVTRCFVVARLAGYAMSAQEVTLLAESNEVELTLRRGGVILVQLHRGGAPCPGVPVAVSRVPIGRTEMAGVADQVDPVYPGPAPELAAFCGLTDANGNAEFHGLADGYYYIAVGRGTIPLCAGPAGVQISSGDAATVAFEIGTVYGCVIRPVNTVIARAYVQCEGSAVSGYYRQCLEECAAEVAARLNVERSLVVLAVVCNTHPGPEESALRGSLHVTSRYRGTFAMDVELEPYDRIETIIDIADTVGRDRFVPVTFDCHGEGVDQAYRESMEFLLVALAQTREDPGYVFKMRCGETAYVPKGRYYLTAHPMIHLESLGLGGPLLVDLDEPSNRSFQVKRRVVEKRIHVIANGISYEGPVMLEVASPTARRKIYMEAVEEGGYAVFVFSDEQCRVTGYIEGMGRAVVDIDRSRKDATLVFHR